MKIITISVREFSEKEDSVHEESLWSEPKGFNENNIYLSTIGIELTFLRFFLI